MKLAFVVGWDSGLANVLAEAIEPEEPKMVVCPDCQGEWKTNQCSRCDHNGMVPAVY